MWAAATPKSPSPKPLSNKEALDKIRKEPIFSQKYATNQVPPAPPEWAKIMERVDKLGPYLGKGLFFSPSEIITVTRRSKFSSAVKKNIPVMAATYAIKDSGILEAWESRENGSLAVDLEINPRTSKVLGYTPYRNMSTFEKKYDHSYSSFKWKRISKKDFLNSPFLEEVLDDLEEKFKERFSSQKPQKQDKK